MMPTPDSNGSSSSSEATSPVSKASEDVVMTEASDLETKAVSKGVALKRKSEDAKVPAAKKAKTVKKDEPKEKKAKKEKAAPTVLELKGKKLVYKTKPISLEAQVVALQQRLAFTQFVNEATEPLDEVPEEHHGALAKIVHESDKTLDQLAKSLRTTFAPQTGSSASIDADNPPIDVLPLSLVKSTIKSIATRTNYGLTSADLDDKEIPALQVWRWQVDDWEKLVAEGLPSDMIEKLSKRVEERESLHEIAVALLDALDEKSKKALLEDKKKDAKGKKKDDAIDVDEESEKKSKKGKGKAKKEKDESRDEEKEEKIKETPEEKAAKKAEREAKKAEREAKKAAAAIKKQEKEDAKAAKEAEKAEKEADKKKKQAALEKQSASAFGSFFVKPKAPASASSSSAKHARRTSEDQTDFDKSFLAFNVAKNVEVAPVNQCIASSSSVKKEVSAVKINSLAEITLKDSLASLMRNASPSSIPKYDPRPKALTSVKEIMHNISEGDLTGTGGTKWYKLLANRQQVPVKVLSFNHTDRRPGYVGTFTKSSNDIRPRKPFNKDTAIFDYDYDSEEAWDDEVADGEDVNSDTAKSDEEMEDVSDTDSIRGEDGQGWMCDDDQVEYIAGFADEDDSADRAEDETLRDEDFKSRQRALQKRQQAQKDSAARAKAAKVLVPVQRGPCWENGSKAAYKGFEGMQIRFLNDAHASLDPFEFVSKVGLKPEIKKEKPLLSVQPDGKPASEGMKRSNSGSKKPFSEHLLTDLVEAIKASSCKTKPELIKELHVKFPSSTKTSIEALLKAFVDKKTEKGVVSWTVSDKITV